MSQVDQKRAFNKLKHDLEPFRALVVKTKSVLTWEKNYYPGIVFGIVSLIYLTLWLAELSFITFISLGVLLLVLGDFLFPTFTRLISNNKWNGEHEAEFEDICTTLCNIKTTVYSWYDFLFQERKSAMFVVMISSALLMFAWLGAVINNLLLMYIATLAITLWPGIQDKHIFKTISEHATKTINSKFSGGGDKKKNE